MTHGQLRAMQISEAGMEVEVFVFVFKQFDINWEHNYKDNSRFRNLAQTYKTMVEQAKEAPQ